MNDEQLSSLAGAFRHALRQAVWMTRRLDAGSTLSVAQLGLLNMTAGEGLRMGVVANNLGVRVPSATEQVARLEKAGLIERCADPHDARAVVVRRTPAGDEAASAANARRNEQMAEALAALTEEERAALRAALPVMDKLNSHLTHQEMPL